MTPKDLLLVNAILGILEVALIALTLMNACQSHVMITLAVLTPKVPLSVNAIQGILGVVSIVLTLMSAC